jgi:serine/threonine protein kinase
VAPELLAANTEASPAADVFSLGACLQATCAVRCSRKPASRLSQGRRRSTSAVACELVQAESAGATLYECIAGKELPRDVPLEAALSRLDISLQLRHLMAALLQPDPAARPTAQVCMLHQSKLAEQCTGMQRTPAACQDQDLMCATGSGTAGGERAGSHWGWYQRYSRQQHSRGCSNRDTRCAAATAGPPHPTALANRRAAGAAAAGADPSDG